MPFDNYPPNIYLVRGGNIEKALGPGTRLGKIPICARSCLFVCLFVCFYIIISHLLCLAHSHRPVPCSYEVCKKRLLDSGLAFP